MIATHHKQQTSRLSFNLAAGAQSHPPRENDNAFDLIEHLSNVPPQLLAGRIIYHHTNAGLNPLVDAASYLFSILGKLRQIQHYQQKSALQQQLIAEIHTFQESIKRQGYSNEYQLVCHYVICATFDDVLGNTVWGGQGQWDAFSLLTAFRQDPQHQLKFFNILEHAIKEPAVYIDMMEFIYICLSLGYKGPYRATEHHHFQLEQITNNLYKHIRAYRGHANRYLSPIPFKAAKAKQKSTSQGHTSLLTMTIVTACIMLATFASLGYLMDVISNESLENVAQIKPEVAYKTFA